MESSTSALLHNHVGNVPLYDVVFIVKVEHGHCTELGGDATGVDRAWTHPSQAVLVDYRRVKRRSRARHPRHVRRAASLAVVAVVTSWCDDPVVPANETEVYVKLLAAAQAAARAVALKASLSDAVLSVYLTSPYHQEGPVGRVSRVHQHWGHAGSLTALTMDFQVLPPAPFPKNSSHCLRQRKRMPSAALQVYALLHQGPASSASSSTTTTSRSSLWAGSPHFLVMDLDSHFPSQALLRASRQHTEEKPEACLGHVQVLVSLIGDEEVEASLRARVFICWRQKTINGQSR